MDDEAYGREAARAMEAGPWKAGEAYYWYPADVTGGLLFRELRESHSAPPDGCDEPLCYNSEGEAFAALGAVVRYIYESVRGLPLPPQLRTSPI